MKQILFLLGIPFHSLTLNETLEQIFKWVSQSPRQTPHYVATVNIQFVFNAIRKWPGQIVSPELISILRNAAIVTADGMPLVWLSRLLRTPLPERVSGSDLLPQIAKRAEEEQKKLFFLGGESTSALEASLVLKKHYPKLNIVGVDASFVTTTGKKIAVAQKEEAQLIQKINQSQADILFIGFGNPKQEIWFERVKYQLKVPVVIGVGGTFSFIAGRIKRAPQWIQNMGFEWLFRLGQEPKRLWKRYSRDIFSLFITVVPLLLYHKISCFLYSLHPHFRMKKSKRRFSSSLPSVLVPKKTKEIFSLMIEIKKNPSSFFVLNFSLWKWASPQELASLFLFLKQIQTFDKTYRSLFLSPQFVHCLKLNFLWDSFQYTLLPPSKQFPIPILQFQQTLSYDLLTLKGRILNHPDHSSFFETLLFQTAPQKPFLVNLQDCVYLDNSALCFLLRIQKTWRKLGYPILIQKSSLAIKALFKQTQIQHLFQFI